MDSFGPDALKLIEIVWINIVLSGDNAVVIALACRGLPPDRQRIGMILGGGVAIVLRIAFTAVIVTLLATPYLKLVGGLLLLWVAVKLVSGQDEDEGAIKGPDKLWKAVRTIALADAVMSLDNVLAIAAVAGDSTVLLIVGLAISIPLIVAGASLLVKLLTRFPILVWAGSALLGWVAGEMMLSDPAASTHLGADLAHRLEVPAGIVAAILVVAIGFALSRWRRSPSAEHA